MRKKLRVAWRVVASVACIVGCVLLVELWVRSYWWNDYFYGYRVTGRELELDSESGWFSIGIIDYDTRDALYLSSHLIEKPMSESPGEGFAYGFSSPYWAACAFIIGLAAAPWIKWRFSLRTLLIALTLIALVLGLTIHSN